MKNPQVPKDRLSGDLSDCYKVKLLSDGYRLVYEPKFEDGVLFIRSVGRRDEDVYQNAAKSLS
jgi:mRNA interferase RelE/StbE